MRKRFLPVALMFLLVILAFFVPARAAISMFKLTADLNYAGTDPVVKDVPAGANVAENLPADPTRTGYGFAGWFLEPECVNELDSQATISGDLTVYAGWCRALEYCDANRDTIICEKYLEITPERTEFNRGEDTYLIFADGCTDLDGIALNGNVTYRLIVQDGQKINVSNIGLGEGTSIEIYSQQQDSGELTMSSGQGKAGIGPFRGAECGDITVNGGILRIGTYSDACIGTSIPKSELTGYSPSQCGNITINGGTVIAETVMGACIGTGTAFGSKTIAGDITINGGTLQLTSESGTCIGTAIVDRGSSKCGNITINGGNITMSTFSTSAIGTPSVDTKVQTCGDVTITGGTLTAKSTAGYTVGKVKSLTITGGTLMGESRLSESVYAEEQVKVTGGYVILKGDGASEVNLIRCAGSVIDESLTAFCGPSELECIRTDRIDLPGINYVKIFSTSEIFDEYEFSLDGDTYTAKKRTDGSKLSLKLSGSKYYFDWKKHGPQFDSGDLRAWFDKIGIYPWIRYYRSDGKTLTNIHDGALTEGGMPYEKGSYVARAEFDANGEILTLPVKFEIIEKITASFSQTEIYIQVGETNESITYSSPYAKYLDVCDVSDIDVIDAWTIPATQRLRIRGREVGTSEIYFQLYIDEEPEWVEYDFPVVTVHVVDDGSYPYPKTGDSGNVMLWIVLFAASSAVLGAWGVMSGKKRATAVAERQ